LKTVSISPSHFTFKLTSCERCWWMSTRGLATPNDIIPAIFRHIDEGMKKGVTIDHLRALGIPAKATLEIEKVVSMPIPYPALNVQLVVAGKLDKAIELEDGTFAVIDYKTSRPAPGKLKDYFDQLHGYVHCIENPAMGEGREVTLIGLVVFDAYRGLFTVKPKDGSLLSAQTGVLTYLEAELDRMRFEARLAGVATLAARDDMPPSGSNCSVCRHAHDMNRFERDVQRIQERKAVAS
jgi:hypothetical protein